jgi:hypothetical protein
MELVEFISSSEEVVRKSPVIHWLIKDESGDISVDMC